MMSNVEGRRGGMMITDPMDLAAHMWNLCVNNTDFTIPMHILVDWLETDQAHIFKANLPGLTKEDVDVKVEENGVIHLSGECKKNEVDENSKWRLLERPYGTFSRHFALPKNAMLDQVKANIINGVLTLRVPKAAESKAKVMAVNISEN